MEQASLKIGHFDEQTANQGYSRKYFKGIDNTFRQFQASKQPERFSLQSGNQYNTNKKAILQKRPKEGTIEMSCTR